MSNLAAAVATRLFLICREPGMIKMRTRMLLQSTDTLVAIPRRKLVLASQGRIKKEQGRGTDLPADQFDLRHRNTSARIRRRWWVRRLMSW